MQKKHAILILAGLVIWLVPTAIFGFNDKPANPFERLTDFVGGTMLIWGIAGDILHGITIVKTTKARTVINTKTLKIERPHDE